MVTQGVVRDGALKPFEDPRLIRGRDADAVVYNRQPGIVVEIFDVHMDLLPVAVLCP